MKRRLAILAVVFGLAALVAVPILYAGPGGPHGHRFGGGPEGLGIIGGPLRHLAEDLDLSDAQKEQIHAIFKELHEQNAQYRESMHDNLKNVMDTLLKNPNDVAAAQALIDQQTATENTLKRNMLTATSKALNVLTPEQRSELAQKIADHAARFEGRRR